MVVLAFGAAMAPGFAAADDLVIPGIGPEQGGPRLGYRDATFPPPQVNILGLPERTPQPFDRPSYGEASQFPPPGGRYGGGFIEYVLTGGRPEPVAPPAYTSPAACMAAPAAAPGYFTAEAASPADRAGASVNSMRASLPRGGLPDYAPQAALGAPAPAGPELGLFNLGPLSLLGGEGGAMQPAAAPAAYAEDPAAALAAHPSNPAFERRFVSYSGRERPGTVVIDTPDKYLYLVQGNGRAIRYGIGVGRPGFAWSGVKSITRKAEWPGWTPPAQMVRRRPDLPRHMVGGEANPLGARALYLGSSLYRIHGTNEPDTIGTNVSSGCIRMMNQDVIDLYGRVGVGTRVVVL